MDSVKDLSKMNASRERRRGSDGERTTGERRRTTTTGRRMTMMGWLVAMEMMGVALISLLVPTCHAANVPLPEGECFIAKFAERSKPRRQ